MIITFALKEKDYFIIRSNWFSVLFEYDLPSTGGFCFFAHYLCTMKHRLHIILFFLLLGLIPAAAQVPSHVDSLRAANSVGTKAADFAIMTTDGNESTLYDTDSRLTLVYLYHPDCYTCIATMSYLEADETFKSMVSSGGLKILAVDLTEDMVSITQNMRPPKGWTLCFNYDARIINDQLYFIEEYPSMYLLDKDKTVLLKNPEAYKLLEYLVGLEDRS